jgi:hypothetical protein
MPTTLLLPLLFVAANSIRPDPAATANAIQYRQPQLAAGNGIVAMAFGGGPSIYFTASTDQGKTFAPPVKVAETGALALGRHRGPRVVILKDALLISAIHGEKVATGPHAHGLPEAGNLSVWRSTDQGKTWSKASVINDVPGAAREGLHTIVAMPDGNSVFAVWLDLRDKGTRLYGAKSVDGGRTWSKNVQVYASPEGTICQCCHPSLAVDTRGTIRVMWRNVMDGSRDMHIASSTDGGLHFTQPAKLGEGTWKINACPMDGGGFVADADGKLTSAWRRENQIFLAESGKTERSLGPGKDVAIVKNARGPFVAWTRGTSIVMQVPGEAEQRVLGADGGFVHLLALDARKVIAAWESKGAIETVVIE